MLAQHLDPILAIATATGRAAIGIVRVSGKRLDKLMLALCGRLLRAREASYTPFFDATGQPIDRGIAIYFPAPHSYTGEDVLELQAHGGTVVLQILLARCLEAAAEIDPCTAAPQLAGLRLALPGEFSQRAFLNGKIDLAQAEAIADLIDASTATAVRSASRSLSGEFSREIQGLLDGLIRLRMQVEALLDFPDEETGLQGNDDVLEQLLNLQQSMSFVQQKVSQGVLLREGIKVVIAGQPNAGKSSLLNALAGADLAIVTPVAGTTRDKLEHTIQIEGVLVQVIDTAGLCASDDEVEKIGVERAWGAIKSADVVMFLHDLTRSHTAQYRAEDEHIAMVLNQNPCSKVAILNIWSKADAVPDTSSHAGLMVSAKTGDGLGALRQKILELAGWQPGSEGVFMARERHLQALREVSLHLFQASINLSALEPALELLAEDLRLAQDGLGEITGEFTSEDLLGVIFSKFCIGK